MGDQKEEPFRFLSDDEFFSLAPESKVTYLVRAQKELEARQRMLGRQAKSDDIKDPE